MPREWKVNPEYLNPDYEKNHNCSECNEKSLGHEINKDAFSL